MRTLPTVPARACCPRRDEERLHRDEPGVQLSGLCRPVTATVTTRWSAGAAGPPRLEAAACVRIRTAKGKVLQTAGKVALRGYQPFHGVAAMTGKLGRRRGGDRRRRLHRRGHSAVARRQLPGRDAGHAQPSAREWLTPSRWKTDSSFSHAAGSVGLLQQRGHPGAQDRRAPQLPPRGHRSDDHLHLEVGRQLKKPSAKK